MLIRFFRSNFIIQQLIITITALLLWFPAFLKPLAPQTSDSWQPLYNWLASWLSSFPLLSVILAFIILVLSAFYLNLVLAENGFVGRTASAAAFLFVILNSLFPTQTYLSSYILALPILVFTLSVLFKMYEEAENEFNLFNAALGIALLGILDFYLVTLLLWLYVSLFVLRMVRLNEWLIPIIGFIIPFFFLASYFFMRNKLVSQALLLQTQIDAFYFQLPEMPSIFTIIGLVLIVLMFIQSVQIVASPVSDHGIFMRKKKAILNALIFFGFLFLFFNEEALQNSQLMLIPVTAYIGYSWMLYKRYLMPQLYLLLLLLFAFVNQYAGLIS